jgi:hypothetical protein
MLWGKPPLGARPDRSHPHARGLRHCFLFNERSGRTITDCVGGLKATFNGSPTWSGRLHGGSLRFDGSSDLSLVAGINVFHRASDNGPFAFVVGVMQETGSQSGFQTLWGNGASGFYLNNGRPIFYNSGSGAVLPTDTPCVISVSSNGPDPVNQGPGEMEYATNGRQEFAANYQALPQMSGATIGGHGSERFIGQLSFLYIYDRPIPCGSSQPDARFDFVGFPKNIGIGGPMAAIHADPFAMFYAQSRTAVIGGFIGGTTGGGGAGAFNALNIAP